MKCDIREAIIELVNKAYTEGIADQGYPTKKFSEVSMFYIAEINNIMDAVERATYDT